MQQMFKSLTFLAMYIDNTTWFLYKTNIKTKIIAKINKEMVYQLEQTILSLQIFIDGVMHKM